MGKISTRENESRDEQSVNIPSTETNLQDNAWASAFFWKAASLFNLSVSLISAASFMKIKHRSSDKRTVVVTAHSIKDRMQHCSYHKPKQPLLINFFL